MQIQKLSMLHFEFYQTLLKICQTRPLTGNKKEEKDGEDIWVELKIKE